jgi:hypothetical protein
MFSFSSLEALPLLLHQAVLDKEVKPPPRVPQRGFTKEETAK